VRRRLPALATIVGVAVALRVVFDGWYLNYDARYALLWARDLVHGHTPEYEAAYAPTPHPLSTLWSILSLPSDQIMVWFVALAFGALVYLVYRLGAELFHPAVGVVAALALVSRPAIQRDALLGYQDIPFTALIVLAALLEARRPKRGLPVLVLLAVAGLLRPEAWVLAGVYWLYAGRELRLAPLVLAAPVLWALMDLIVTGDALHSLHGTADLAEANDRRNEIGQVPRSVVEYLGFALRWPLILGIPLGLAFAVRFRLKRALIPLAIVVVLTAVFAVNPVFGLPLIARYMRVSAAVLMVFYGLAVFGWLLLEREHRERRLWMAVGAVAAVASLAYLPRLASEIQDVRERTATESARYESVRAVARTKAVRAAFAACPPLATTDHRPLPYLRWWLDGDPGSLVTLEGRHAGTGSLLIVPRHNERTKVFRWLENRSRPKPPGWRRVARNGSWKVYADC
jgi:drug/metabolite transporter superfamily protein YnfA